VSAPIETAEDRIRTTVPAWGMSLVLHLTLLLAIALVTTSPTISRGLEEADREGAIVLVNADAATQADRYFSEADQPQQELTNPAQEVAPQQPQVAPSEAATESLNDLLPETPDQAALAPAVFGQPLSAFKGAGKNLAGSQAAQEAEAAAVAAERAALEALMPQGPTTKVSVFGSAAAEGRTFTFVVDRSASMGEDGLGMLAVAQTQLEAAVAGMGPTHRFQIVAYNQRPTYLGPKQMTPATEDNKKLVKQFFLTLGAYGGTEHEIALVTALAAKPDVIFLLTDGGDPYLHAGNIRRLWELARGTTTIHCIQFGRGPPIGEAAAWMKRLAEGTGGGYTYVDVNR
jgi:hypothetical protein